MYDNHLLDGMRCAINGFPCLFDLVSSLVDKSEIAEKVTVRFSIHVGKDVRSPSGGGFKVYEDLDVAITKLDTSATPWQFTGLAQTEVGLIEVTGDYCSPELMGKWDEFLIRTTQKVESKVQAKA